MRSKLKVKPIVPQLVKPDAEYTESDEEVAGVLSDFFKSVSQKMMVWCLNSEKGYQKMKV